MNFKTVLLAGVAVAFSASVASAASVRPYVSAKVGATMEYADVKADKKEDETKIFGSAALGLDFALYSGNIRTELEYTYRNQMTGKFAAGEGKFKNQSAFFNLYYDLPVKWAIKPYVGTGLGFSRVEGKIDTVKKNKNIFGWNLGAGVTWHMSKSFGLDLGYRYLHAGEWKSAPYKVELYNHEFFAGLRYTF